MLVLTLDETSTLDPQHTPGSYRAHSSSLTERGMLGASKEPLKILWGWYTRTSTTSKGWARRAAGKDGRRVWPMPGRVSRAVARLHGGAEELVLCAAQEGGDGVCLLAPG